MSRGRIVRAEQARDGHAGIPRTWRLGGLAVLVAAAVAAPYTLPSYLVGLLSLVAIAALFAASINLLAEAGLISVGHAGISAAAGYGLAYATVHGQPLPVAILAAAGVTLVVSAIFAVTSMRTAQIYFLMVTLALGMVVFGVAYRFNQITGGENGLANIDRPPAVDAYWLFYFFCVAVLAVCLAALWVINRSPFGMSLRGIRDSESRMRSLGYNVAAHKFFAFLLSGVFAGISGVLSTWYAEFISPVSAGFIRSALGVVMVILGGAGALLGPLAGAAIVVVTENVVSGYIERWQTVLGLIFIVVVLFVPQGLAGLVAQAARRLAATRRATPRPDPSAASGTPPGGDRTAGTTPPAGPPGTAAGQPPGGTSAGSEALTESGER